MGDVLSPHTDLSSGFLGDLHGPHSGGLWRHGPRCGLGRRSPRPLASLQRGPMQRAGQGGAPAPRGAARITQIFIPDKPWLCWPPRAALAEARGTSLPSQPSGCFPFISCREGGKKGRKCNTLQGPKRHCDHVLPSWPRGARPGESFPSGLQDCGGGGPASSQRGSVGTGGDEAPSRKPV